MSKPNTTAVRRAPDDNALAWELAAAAHPHLNKVDADRIYIAIGIGETFDAIDALIAEIARNRIPLDADVIATVATWLNCYVGQHDTEPRLRELLTEVTTVVGQQTSTQAPMTARSATRARRYRRSG